jgi:hypothetical protein
MRIQYRHPHTGRWVIIDSATGLAEAQGSDDPYPDVPIWTDETAAMERAA